MQLCTNNLYQYEIIADMKKYHVNYFYFFAKAVRSGFSVAFPAFFGGLSRSLYIRKGRDRGPPQVRLLLARIFASVYQSRNQQHGSIAMTLRIAALASGNGTNVAAILRCIEKGRLDAKMELVLSNRPQAPVLDKARAAGVPVWARDHREYPDREAFDRAMLEEIRRTDADTVVLAGYMRLVSPVFLRAFPDRVLNVHPAILPSFPGLLSTEDAIEYGVRVSGATVHFVTEQTDHGPVIIQAVVPVTPNDTGESLLPRIHALEHRIFPQALQWLAQGRLSIHGRRVHLHAAKVPHAEQASTGIGPLGPWMVSPPLEGF